MEKYFLHINEPCTQDWDEMTTVGQGKFCNNCKKNVFDFTSASDNDIIKHMEKMKGAAFCGKFEEHQLDRWIHTSNLKTSNKKLYELLLSFLILTGSQNLYAQDVSNKENIELQRKADSTFSVAALKVEMPYVNCNKQIALTGKVAGLNAINSDSLFSKKSKFVLGTVRRISNKDNDPLIVVNGVIINDSALYKLNLEDIKSISVVKSGEASAIYGAKALNGVLIIETKGRRKE
jgi:TonB-dependent SusC/RagA subfamily outer membrane receptor